MPDCGKINHKPAAGCEAENLTSVRLVELDKTLYLSSEGFLTLTYRGPLRVQSGEFRKYTLEMDADIVQTSVSGLHSFLCSVTKTYQAWC